MRKLKAMLSWVTVVCLTLIFFSIADFSVSAATVNSNIISGETYRLVNVGSGKYLNLSGGNNANGANINQFTGDNSITQDFIIRWIASESCYKIYSACSDEGNDRVLDVKRGGNPHHFGVQRAALHRDRPHLTTDADRFCRLNGCLLHSAGEQYFGLSHGK